MVAHLNEFGAKVSFDLPTFTYPNPKMLRLICIEDISTWMAGSVPSWASPREQYTVWTAVIMALFAFVAILIACFFKDMNTAEKIVTVLVSFVGTPLGYLFGYSTTKSAEVSAKEDVAALEKRIAVMAGAFDSFKSSQQIDSQIINDLKLALEKEKALKRIPGDR